MAGQKISEFQYRKMFGLSKADMLNEPLEDFFINSFIESTTSKKEQHDIKKAEPETQSKTGRIKHG